MSELLDNQFKLFSMLCRLRIYAESLGYKAKFGAALVHEDDTVHSPNSLHRSSLAVDVLLFRGNKYLTNTIEYEELGEYWERMGGSWGGRFNDGNHFSISMWGRK